MQTLMQFIQVLIRRLERGASGDMDAFAGWQAQHQAIHGALERKRLVDRQVLVRAYELADSGATTAQMLFAIETAYALGVRAQAARLLVRSDALSLPDSFARDWFNVHGIVNFPPAAPFDWWLARSGEAEHAAALRIRAALPAAADTTAWLHGLHHRLLPRPVRHALGVHYTPGWLADELLDGLLAADPALFDSGRILDPTCGAGTFLAAALRRMLTAHPHAPETLPGLLTRIAGIDIDPLAILAAQTSLIAALAPWQHRKAVPLSLPIIQADILSLPEGTFAQRFDAVVGNPPWLNWEYLPPALRERSAQLWETLGLFGHGGLDRAHSKEEIAGLIAALTLERFLRPAGLLGMILPHSLFKSALNGQGFRRFQLGNGPSVRVLRVDDLSNLKLFDGSGLAAILLAQRDAPTTYPVRYRRWHRAPPDPRVEEQAACPSDPANPGSGWISGPPAALDLITRLSGTNPYRARTGMFTGGANGVYYLELLEQRPDGLLRVRNLVERTRRTVPQVEAILEPTFLFPLIRGRDVGSWHMRGAALVLCPHTAQSRMQAVAPAELAEHAPRMLAYLEQFRAVLNERRGFTRWEQPYRHAAFYACQRIGTYTFAPYKVVWRYIASDFRCCVVGPQAGPNGTLLPAIPHEKLMLLAFDTPEEAFYVCGLLSSSPARCFIESRMVATQIAPHVIARLALPRFDAHNAHHRQLADVCHTGHQAMQRGDTAQAHAMHEAIDRIITGILPISPGDVATAQACIA